MKVYALHLKQISTVGVSHEILQNFRIATFGNNFGGRGGGPASEKKTAEKGAYKPIFINLRKGFYYQDFKGRNTHLLLGR